MPTPAFLAAEAAALAALRKDSDLRCQHLSGQSSSSASGAAPANAGSGMKGGDYAKGGDQKQIRGEIENLKKELADSGQQREASGGARGGRPPTLA